MDEIKKRVLKELMGSMDERMDNSLKSRMKPKVEIEVASENVSRPDKGWGAIIHKPGNMEQPEMAQMSPDDDEERLMEMYRKLK